MFEACAPASQGSDGDGGRSAPLCPRKLPLGCVRGPSARACPRGKQIPCDLCARGNDTASGTLRRPSAPVYPEARFPTGQRGNHVGQVEEGAFDEGELLHLLGGYFRGPLVLPLGQVDNGELDHPEGHAALEPLGLEGETTSNRLEEAFFFVYATFGIPKPLRIDWRPGESVCYLVYWVRFLGFLSPRAQVSSGEAESPTTIRNEIRPPNNQKTKKKLATIRPPGNKKAWQQSDPPKIEGPRKPCNSQGPRCQTRSKSRNRQNPAVAVKPTASLVPSMTSPRRRKPWSCWKTGSGHRASGGAS